MKKFIKYIGVVDNENNIHHVEFSQGVNVITGKSSTGKSAMIEIFDYCFGNSENTVPHGVITKNAQFYFCVITLNKINIVLARKPDPHKGFIKEISDSEILNIDAFKANFFKNSDFILLKDYKIYLGQYFGIDIVDTDLDLTIKDIRGKKLPRPSVRHFTSFMLQHQNLVANKHTLFYRFDEKEKREQTIDQLKIFAGYVNQEYFIKSQQLAELENDLKRLKTEDEKERRSLSLINIKIKDLLSEYHAVTGIPLINAFSESLIGQPSKYLDVIQQIEIKTNVDSNEYSEKRHKLLTEKNSLLAKVRELENNRINISSSILYAEKYKNQTEDISTLDKIELHASICPFCDNHNEAMPGEVNKLNEAINWLNNELAKTPYLLDSFKSDEKKVGDEIKLIKEELSVKNNEIQELDKILQKLKINQGLEEQGLKVKFKIESLLEEAISNKTRPASEKIIEKQKEFDLLNNYIIDNYNYIDKQKEAENYINNKMKLIGQEFEFEASYKPINLFFSLETFELYHKNEDGKKVYLRSMGSGANWLYSHLTLFLALQNYFCSLKDKCLIPPFLFIDQPSQVYFPSQVDIMEEFDPKSLKKLEGKEQELKTDEDILAVTNMYNQLVKHCLHTKMETGIMPQIIVTDHADNLKLDKELAPYFNLKADLENKVELNDTLFFEQLVNGRRWRKKGFIEFKNNL